MRDFINRTVRDLPPSGIRRFFNLAAEMEDVISLGVGEPDFLTPWNIREEAIYTLEKGRTIYTANAGLMELRREISRYLQRKYHLEYDPATQILVTVGGSEAIDLALRSIVEPGDEVLIPEPSFVAYKPCAVMAGGKAVPVPLRGENGFKLTVEDLEPLVNERSKVLIFPYPGNPTGATMHEEDMRALCEWICQKDLFVISDEIYSELTYDGDHVSIASMPGMSERTLVINGFSKAFSMTGWRLGYGAGPKDLLEQMTKVHQFAIMCAPTTSQYAAIEALRNCDRAVEEMRQEYNRRRRLVVASLREMGLSCNDPGGAFYVFPSIQSTGMTSEAFCQDLLHHKKIAVVPGDAFGASGEGYVRISYAYSVEQLRLALGRIAEYMQEHP
ncbi:MAG TPA: aminotransferase class I/II-fold pyridoxal phosphate-dependent enzyme [Candidatus Faecimorpha stercoravium]|nr:aminotransferase class I/II-fold pyridoxal phosphate-dependent enzyme [Candidatus Faecimorpha stercoravium]